MFAVSDELPHLLSRNSYEGLLGLSIISLEAPKGAPQGCEEGGVHLESGMWCLLAYLGSQLSHADLLGGIISAVAGEGASEASAAQHSTVPLLVENKSTRPMSTLQVD